MLICDTHADTLFAQVPGESQKKEAELDVTREMLCQNEKDTRLQVLALYVATGGMERQPTIVEQELTVLDRMLQNGWHQVKHVAEAQVGQANGMLSIEGCEAFQGKLEKVEEFAARGVRIAALMWNNENGIGHPAVGKDASGLTEFGRRLVSELRKNKIAVDISHLNIAGSDEVMDSSIPPMASHSCAYALCAHPRNLNDDQLRRLFRAGGFVGVNFYGKFLSENGIASTDTVVDHMVHMCELGGENCIGFGSDFDGIDVYPQGLRNAGELPNLFEAMQKRGFSAELCEKIAGLNFKNYMNRIDGEAIPRDTHC